MEYVGTNSLVLASCCALSHPRHPRPTLSPLPAPCLELYIFACEWVWCSELPFIYFSHHSELLWRCDGDSVGFGNGGKAHLSLLIYTHLSSLGFPAPFEFLFFRNIRTFVNSRTIIFLLWSMLGNCQAAGVPLLCCGMPLLTSFHVFPYLSATCELSLHYRLCLA